MPASPRRLARLAALALVAAGALAPAPAHAQFGRLRDAARRAAGRAVEAVAPRAGEPTTEATPADAPAGSPSAAVAAAVLFATDFSRDAPGDFPAGFALGSGTFEVADVRGRRVLRATAFGEIHVELPADLPERFALEFLLAGPSGWYQDVLFANGARTYVHLRPHDGGLAGETRASTQPASDPGPHRLFPVRVVVEGERARVYHGRTVVANVPRADLGRSDRVTFRVSASQSDPVLIADVRLTTDAAAPAPGAPPSSPTPSTPPAPETPASRLALGTYRGRLDGSLALPAEGEAFFFRGRADDLTPGVWLRLENVHRDGVRVFIAEDELRVGTYPVVHWLSWGPGVAGAQVQAPGVYAGGRPVPFRQMEGTLTLTAVGPREVVGHYTLAGPLGEVSTNDPADEGTNYDLHIRAEGAFRARRMATTVTAPEDVTALASVFGCAGVRVLTPGTVEHPAVVADALREGDCAAPDGGGHVDYYALHLGGDYPSRIEVALADPAFAPQLIVLDAAGYSYVHSNSADTFGVLYPGVYVVAVRSEAPGGGGAYTLRLSTRGAE